MRHEQIPSSITTVLSVRSINYQVTEQDLEDAEVASGCMRGDAADVGLQTANIGIHTLEEQRQW